MKKNLEHVEFELLMKTQEKMTRRQINLRGKVKLVLYMLEEALYKQHVEAIDIYDKKKGTSTRRDHWGEPPFMVYN